jgi:hypothetical protein
VGRARPRKDAACVRAPAGAQCGPGSRGLEGAIDNRLDEHGNPICPACGRAIPSGESAARVGNLAVHLDCLEQFRQSYPRKPPAPAEDPGEPPSDVTQSSAS